MLRLAAADLCLSDALPENNRHTGVARRIGALGIVTLLCGLSAMAQTNVVTQRYDISRSGVNTNETILTPSNVSNSFGKLFSQPVDGRLFAEPLYVPNLSIPGKGTHNVVFAATAHDSVYAFDADNNGGANASPLWQITLLDAAHGAATGATTVPNTDLSTNDIVPEIGIIGTPAIDTSTNTMYVVGKTKESGTYILRLHALDITTGAEKFGGPVALSAHVSGNGNGSSGGTLNFDNKWENNRPGLLLLNGYVYLGFGSHGDNGPWHGWILAYNATTLNQTSVWCGSPNGIGSGVWLSGLGLSADTNNPSGNSPGGRIFAPTGNGTYDATKPYDSTMDFGDSIVRLELNNGVITVADAYTPTNQSTLNSGDLDVSSGGALILPDQSSGGHTHLLVQAGKEGRISLVDRDSMGGYNTSSDNIVQEIPTAGGSTFQIQGMWSTPTYWNGRIFFWAVGDYLKSFSFTNGKLSSTPSQTGTTFLHYPGSNPTISASGSTNGIVWTVETSNSNNGVLAVMRAFDATDVTKQLYSTNTNSTQDNPGVATKYLVPTVMNGKVYLGAADRLNVYGLTGGATQAAAPVISPAGQSFTGSLTVTITDGTPNALIFYSTTGTATTSSTPYTGPITVSTSETISAIASASGFLQSPASSQTYLLQTQTLMPTFSPIPGAYGSTQTITLSDGSPNPTIYYAINGPASTSSTLYTGPITVSQSETINAVATSPGLSASPQASATYAIGGGVSFSGGFSTSASSMTFQGSTKLNDTRLQLTDGGAQEAAAAWYNVPVNIQTFNNNFTFQLSNPSADGFTFTIQNTGRNALGPSGGGLGYGPDAAGGTGGIGKSVAIKFDLYDNGGEGPNSTGLYTNGASPTLPATTFGGGIDLHSGNTFSVNMVYDGTKLTMTITDGVTNATFQTSWAVNIPQIVGGNTAYVGFTAGTGGLSSSQKIETWTLVSTTNTPPPPPPAQAATPTFSLPGGSYSSAQNVTLSASTANATIFYTLDGTTPGTSVGGSTSQYTSAINVATSETIKAIATAPNFSPSNVATAAYVISSLPAAATPLISPVTGTYTSAQTVTITDATSGSSIFYALNGPASTSSTPYTAPFVVNTTTTVNAIASASGFANSPTGTSTITLQTSTGTTPVNFAAGFSAGGLQFNGHTRLNGTRLQLTDTTAANEAASAFWTTPVNVQNFTNDFTFQQTSPSADGFTFTIQGVGATAIGPGGGGLGYGPDAPGGTGGIANSLAVKFDIFDNNGEGPNSTGLSTNGASPTTPATTLGGNVNLHNGDVFHVVMSYDGTTLTMTITDTSNTAQTFTTSWPINIPSTVGGNTAYVGFTAGTGGLTSTQEIITWSYSTGGGTAPPGPKTPVVYQVANLAATSSGPTWRQIAWSGFPDGTGAILDATAAGDNVTLTVNVPTAGTYDVKVSMKDLNTRGIYQLAINGANVGVAQDEYQTTGSGAFIVTDLGNFNFAAAGNYAFKFTVTGKNASSSGFTIAFDDITLTPQ
jgi:hypothetical protein